MAIEHCGLSLLQSLLVLLDNNSKEKNCIDHQVDILFYFIFYLKERFCFCDERVTTPLSYWIGWLLFEKALLCGKSFILLYILKNGTHMIVIYVCVTMDNSPLKKIAFPERK